MATINKKYGQTYIATATPNTGYRFVRWTGTGVSTTDNPATLTCLGDNTIEAIFERLQYTLNVGVYPATSGTIVFDPQPASENVIRYTSATAATSDWISENTDTTKNTYNSSTGQGVLYVNKGVYALGSTEDTASADASRPFGTTPITSLDLSDFTYEPNTRTITDPIIGTSAFIGNTSLTTVTIGPAVQWIGPNAFQGCTNLTTVNIQGNVTISEWAFAECVRLATINVTGSIKAIMDGAFNGCTLLASLTLPTGLKYIGRHAFYGCTSLASVSLPEGLEYLGEDVFALCNLLTSLTLPSTVGYTATIRPTTIFKSYAPPIIDSLEGTMRFAAQVPSNAVSVWQSYTFDGGVTISSITSNGTSASVTSVPIYTQNSTGLLNFIRNTLEIIPTLDPCQFGDGFNSSVYYNAGNATVFAYNSDQVEVGEEEYEWTGIDSCRVSTDRYFNTYTQGSIEETGAYEYSAEQTGTISEITPITTPQENSIIYFMAFDNGTIKSTAAYVMDSISKTCWDINHEAPTCEESMEYCECCGEPLVNGECTNVCCDCSPYYDPEQCGGDEPEPEEEPEE